MIFVFDLDHTLLHTQTTQHDIAKLFAAFGVPEKVWRKTYRELAEQGVLFSPWRQFALLKKRGVAKGTLSEFQKAFRKQFHSYDDLLHDGAEKLLELCGKKGKVVLLTYGEAWYQKYKVDRLRIKKYFAEEVYTQHQKDVALWKILKKHPKERVVFIDDSKKHITAVKIRFPEIFVIQARNHCCKDAWDRADFADASFDSLRSLIQKIQSPAETYVPKVEITKYGLKNAALLAKNLLDRKKIISVPTETSYGLAADATSREAVSQIYKIKDRDESKRIPFMVRDRAQLKKYVKLSKQQEKWLQKYENKTVSFLMPKTKGKLDLVGGVGRKATHPFLRELAKNFNNPFTITSTNISGQPSIYKFEEYQAQFAGHNQQVDAFFDYGTLKANPASTILDITQNPPIVLRQGKTKINVKESFSSKSHKKTS